MRRRGLGLLIMLLAGLLAGCTANAQTMSKLNERITVDIQVPKEISINQESALKVQVKQGDKPVENAEEVRLEIWNGNDREHSQTINAHHGKNGVYSIKKTFDKDGIYYVQAHVKMGDEWVMPKKRFAVGNVFNEQLQQIEENASENGQPHHPAGHHH